MGKEIVFLLLIGMFFLGGCTQIEYHDNVEDLNNVSVSGELVDGDVLVWDNNSWIVKSLSSLIIVSPTRGIDLTGLLIPVITSSYVSADYFVGDGSRLTGLVDLDSNAQTACSDLEYLRGDGSCQTIVLSNDTNFETAGYGDLNMDLNYLQIGNNISLLTNDSGFITSFSDTNFETAGFDFSNYLLISSYVDSNATTECDLNEVLLGNGVCLNISEISGSVVDTNCSVDGVCVNIVYVGDNISDLVNDSGFLSSISGLNVSLLTNDSGFITSYYDSNAETSCGDNEYLRGDGSCQTISLTDTDTNFETAGYSFEDYLLKTSYLDTNAETSCDLNEVLLGNGVCVNTSSFGGSGITDSNWQTSWVNFDSNMGLTYAGLDDVNLWVDTKISESSGGTWGSITGDIEDQTDLWEQITKINYNLALNSFRIAINGSLSLFGMIDGFVDEYEDETGISVDTNASYNASNDYYFNSSESGGLGEDLVSRYTFDDDTTTSAVVDDVSSNNGVLENGLNDYTSENSVAGLLDDALDFDGTEDYVLVTGGTGLPIYSTSTPYSISMWINPDDVTTNYGVFMSMGNSGTSSPIFLLEISLTDGKLGALIRDDSSVQLFDPAHKESNTTISNGNWYHIVWTDNQGDANLYVNTSLDATDYSYTPSALTLNRTTIGAMGRTTIESFFNGQIDEVRFYDKALSTDEISDLYNSGAGTSSISAGGTNNMILESESFSAVTEPDSARIIILEEDDGNVSLNTDLNVFLSKDNGSTWDSVFLNSDYNFSSNIKVLTGTTSLTSSGTNIKYKIETYNNKATKIHGACVSWD